MSGTQKIFRKYLEHPHFKLFLCGTEMNLPQKYSLNFQVTLVPR